MANIRVTQLPQIVIPTSGSIAYIINGSQSYKGTIDDFANVILNNYGLFTTPLSASVMTSGNAEILLEGLNNAGIAKLQEDRVDLSNVYATIADLYFDVDGGSFWDTYVNTSTFDGGTF